MNNLVAVTFLVIITLPFTGISQEKIYEPARGSSERKIHMDLLRKELTPQFNGQQLTFEVIGDFYKSDGQWTLIYVNAFQPGGKPVDFKNSAFKKDFGDGSIDSNGIFALLRKKALKWTIVTMAAFPTDVPIGCWWKEFKAPKAIFGRAAMSAADCRDFSGS